MFSNADSLEVGQRFYSEEEGCIELTKVDAREGVVHFRGEGYQSGYQIGVFRRKVESGEIQLIKQHDLIPPADVWDP